MGFAIESTWMESQKHAMVMAPGRDFQVIQAKDGAAIFLSIGTDNVLYATRELQTSTTGWKRVDLSSGLASRLKSSNVTAKTFTVSQNVQTLAFDIALVTTTSGVDTLHLSTGNSADPVVWTGGVEWKSLPFDDKNRSTSSPVTIDGVYLANLPVFGEPNGVQTCFVDVYQKTPATDPLKLLDRYYIDLSAAPFWRKHTLPIDLAAGSISSCLGRRNKDDIGGIYTFGRISDTQQLIYATAYNEYDPGTQPKPARLQLPTGSNSIAASLDGKGKSNLFVSASKGIHMYPPNAQNDLSESILIVPSPMAANATDLEARSGGGTTGVWGVNPQGQLFYTSCATGSETDPKAWSPPVSIVAGVHHYAFFINAKLGNHQLFAHSKGQDVIQLTQDPITTEWSQRSILLPPTDIQNVVKFNSFITNVQYSSGTATKPKTTELSLTATSPVGVYINDAYYVLKPTVPVVISLVTSGTLHIVQPTDNSSAVPYTIKVKGTNESVFTDPAAGIRGKLQGISSAKDLDKIMIKNSDGSQRALIPSDISKEDREAVASALKQFAEVAKTVPADGSRATENTAPAAGPAPVASNFTDTTIPISVGDFFRSLASGLWNDFKTFVVKAVNGIYHVVAKIGDFVYRAVLDCASAISNAVEYVFSKIKVFVKDLIQWLGFVFNWGDIVRTHKVVKNVVMKYARHNVSRITDVNTSITKSFDGLNDKLKTWSGLPDRGGVLGDRAESGKSGEKGYNNPQATWVGDQAASNLPNAEISPSSKPAPEGWMGVLEDLKKLVQKEGDAVSHTMDLIKTQIIEPYSTLTAMQVVQRLMGIIGGLVLDTAKNIIITILDIVRILADKVLDGLDEPIKIPVLSSLYKTIAGEDLSVLDLVCLIAAAPATIIYKAITQATPFPDDSHTASLINAPDFPTIQKILHATDPASIAKFKTFCVAAEFVGMAGSWLMVLMSKFKVPFVAANKPDKIPGFVVDVTVPTRLLMIMPSVALATIPESAGGQSWERTMYSTMTNIAFFKTILDASSIGDKDVYLKVSPFVDYAIAAVWIVPAVCKLVSDSSKDSSYLVLGRNLATDFATMLAPIVWVQGDPETRLIALALTDGLYIVSSGLGVVTAKLMWDGK